MCDPGLVVSANDFPFFLVRHKDSKCIFKFLNKPLKKGNAFDDVAVKTSKTLQLHTESLVSLRDRILVAKPRRHTFVSYLSWAFSLELPTILKLLKTKKFVLTNDFLLKLILVHERQCTGLPLVVVGKTGVGKTFLLDMYAMLLNEKAASQRFLAFNKWFLEVVVPKCQVSSARAGEDESLNDLIEEHLKGRRSPEDMLAMTVQEMTDLWRGILHRHLTPAERQTLTTELAQQVDMWYDEAPPLIRTEEAKELLERGENSTAILSCYLKARVDGLFHRLLVHPGTSRQDIEHFLQPICQFASGTAKRHGLRVVALFDEMNTSRHFSVFKEVIVDHQWMGKPLPPNIFFVATANPREGSKAEDGTVHTYDLDRLPPSFVDSKWEFGGITSTQELEEYIDYKLDLDDQIGKTYSQEKRKQWLMQILAAAHEFVRVNCGDDEVSQRDIERVFTLIPFFQKLKGFRSHFDRDWEISAQMAISLVYCWRLPVDSDTTSNVPPSENAQKIDKRRAAFFKCLAKVSPEARTEEKVQNALDRFVTPSHFKIPEGMALTNALKENILCTVACVQLCVPLCILGQPGSSKTASYYIVRENLRGSNSPKVFCEQFVEIESFSYHCSEWSTANEIAEVFERALQWQKHWSDDGGKKRCVVFMDEAGLPGKDTRKLKVLHRYLDKPKIAFVALSNEKFDPANRNRMLTICRSIGWADFKILAQGCLVVKANPPDRVVYYIDGLCNSFQKILNHSQLKKYFHRRDFIYFLRHLRREQLEKGHWQLVPDKKVLLAALEENFGGLSKKHFQDIVRIFFNTVHNELSKCGDNQFDLDGKLPEGRDNLEILTDLLLHPHRKHPTGHYLAPRFVMVIDAGDGYTATDVMYQLQLLEHTSSQVFQVSDLAGDRDSVHVAEVLAQIRRSLEQPKTIVLVNSGRVQGSLYELLNQNFQHSAQGEHYSFTNIAAGHRMYPCRIHRDFRCVVVVKESDLERTPLPFMSRFSKLRLSVVDMWSCVLNSKQLWPDNSDLSSVESQCRQFLQHIGVENLVSYSDSCDLVACLLLSHIQKKKDGTFAFRASPTHYTRYLEEVLGSKSNRTISKVRAVQSRLLQLMLPETVVLDQAVLEDFSSIYMHLQHHFHLHEALRFIVRNTGLEASKVGKPSSSLRQLTHYMPT